MQRRLKCRLSADSEDSDEDGEGFLASPQYEGGESRGEENGTRRMKSEEGEIYAEMASFLTARSSSSTIGAGKGSMEDDEGEAASRLRFFEDVIRFQEERLRIVKRYLQRTSTSSGAPAPSLSPAAEEALGIAAKIDSLFSFENLIYMFEDVDEWTSRLPQHMSALTSGWQKGPTESGGLSYSSASSTSTSSLSMDSTDVHLSSTTTSPQRPDQPTYNLHHRKRFTHTAKRSVKRFDRLLQDLKNERREERTRAHLRRDEHYRVLQESVGSRLDASVVRTRVWSLRTSCAFAIFDHALDERSEYRGVLPTELNEYVNVVAFPRRFRRVRWVSVTNRLAQRKSVSTGATGNAAVAANPGLGGVAAAAAVSGLGSSDSHDSVYERDANDEDSDDDERRVCEVIAVFEFVPENITFTVKHILPRGNMIEELTITCFGEDFIECSPGHSKGANLFTCSNRHVATLTRDKLHSKNMTTFIRSLQTPKGVQDSDLLYILLLIYESGLTYPSFSSGLVQSLKQKLISFNAPSFI